MICRQLTEPGAAHPAGAALEVVAVVTAVIRTSTAVIASLRIADPLSVVTGGLPIVGGTRAAQQSPVRVAKPPLLATVPSLRGI
ncbi:hypothetical protein Aglo01_12590 [Actinokineospora globicatena]|nr:hypothetical protein Aglo01_12590 [Actinokineospora globicatena]GLW83610.1 hypothetical protein Aglo02_12500 [Actinokineospora globicatena]